MRDRFAVVAIGTLTNLLAPIGNPCQAADGLAFTGVYPAETILVSLGVLVYIWLRKNDIV